eukprot:Em0003g1099a
MKRSKQRAEYLQKQDNILSQENKAKARARYKADPEKKKASVRDSYKADPEKKKASVRDSYKADPEKKKASVRDSYKADPEKKRPLYATATRPIPKKKKASVRDSYKADPKKKKASVRDSYKADPEKKKASVRDSYNADIDVLKGSNIKRTSRRTAPLKGRNSAAIKASERNRYWNDPAVRLAKRAAERKRYRRDHRTTLLPKGSYLDFEPLGVLCLVTSARSKGPGTLCSNECGFVKYDIKKVTKITATWTPSTHALVHFLSDDTIVIVPLKRVAQVDNEVLKEGVNCLVKWTDGVQYEATVKAIGSAEKMQSIQDTMMLSGSDESDRDEEDVERKATQGKETDTVVVEEDDVATEGAARKRPKAAAPKKSALKAEASRMNQELMKKATCSYSEASIGLYNSRSPVASASSSLYNSRSPVASIPPNSSQAITNPEAKPTTVVEEDKEELGSGNCTPAPGRQLLNPAIIQGIRLHVNYKYPADSDEEKARWKKLLHINLNSKCRNARASLLSASKC